MENKDWSMLLILGGGTVASWGGLLLYLAMTRALKITGLVLMGLGGVAILWGTILYPINMALFLLIVSIYLSVVILMLRRGWLPSPYGTKDTKKENRNE